VSVMHVNNETGIRQPIGAIADGLPDGVFFHTDASQGFGKDLETLRHPRLDLISISGHKVFAPKGVGALVLRRRNRKRPPVAPLMFGGGQERGFRPGTLPVPSAAALGLAAELAEQEWSERRAACLSVRTALLDELAPLGPCIHGDSDLSVPHILNVSIPGVDGEAAILALRNTVAVSNGSACTSEKYEPSHVLQAMGVDPQIALGAIRFSWTHLATPADVAGIAAALGRLA
jgi:cysteine desulfurase